MDPKWCDEHKRSFERLSNRNVVCQECYNRRRREKYAQRKHKMRERQANDRAKRIINGKTRAWRVKYNEDLKRETFKAYGGVCCKCCEESELDRLALDHINNNGHEHRAKTRRSGVKLYSWLRTHEWPLGYQVLCHNCNIVKRSKRYATENPTRKQTTTKHRKDEVKRVVLTHYSDGKLECVRCKFNNLVALTIDHTNNDGYLTRDKIASGYPAYLAIMKQEFPGGFQTLCFCCNMEKEIRLRR